MSRVVINNDYGGFSLSSQVLKEIGKDRDYMVDRNDPKLLAFIDKHGLKAASGSPRTSLAIAKIPETWGEFWNIEEYDGAESIVFDSAKWLLSKLNLMKQNMPSNLHHLIDETITEYDDNIEKDVEIVEQKDDV